MLRNMMWNDLFMLDSDIMDMWHGQPAGGYRPGQHFPSRTSNIVTIFDTEPSSRQANVNRKRSTIPISIVDSRNGSPPKQQKALVQEEYDPVSDTESRPALHRRNNVTGVQQPIRYVQYVDDDPSEEEQDDDDYTRPGVMSLAELEERQQLERALSESRTSNMRQQELEQKQQDELHRAIQKSREENYKSLEQKNLGLLDDIHVDDAVKNIGKIVQPISFSTLHPGRDIDSDCINGFIDVVKYFTNNVAASSHRPVQSFNTYFSTYLGRWFAPDGSDFVASMEPTNQTVDAVIAYNESKIRDDVNRINWLERGFVVLPIHWPGHWILVIINLDNYTIELWNSIPRMKRGNHFWSEALVALFTSANLGIPEDIRNKFSVNDHSGIRTVVTDNHQTHDNDCGAFVCYYLLNRVVLNRDVEDVVEDPRCNPDYMKHFRRNLQYVLTPFVSGS